MPPAPVVGAPFDPTNPMRPSEDTHRIFQWAHLNSGNAGDQKALLDDGWSYAGQDGIHNKFYRKAWSSSRGTVTNPLLPETDRADKFQWVALNGDDLPTAHRAPGYSYTASKFVFSRERHGDVHQQLVHVYRKRRADAPAAEAAPGESDDDELAVRLPVRPVMQGPPIAPEDDEVVPVEDFNEPAPAPPAPAPPARRVRARVENLREAHRRQDRAFLRDRAARA